ncbi:MAG: hypothetical protein A2V86_17460 [Deltaproteobacteria bacterium RBG_16_49_23]|nr:MAG: hypothetical protein A2V86_17460 [Deltaproteobacteria bacterium RBG_16_49_23]
MSTFSFLHFPCGLKLIYKIPPHLPLPSGPEALRAGGQREVKIFPPFALRVRDRSLRARGSSEPEAGSETKGG